MTAAAVVPKQRNQALETSFERLSTGKRVNSAVDDAAGLAIGKDLDSRVHDLNQAVRNVNDGISMVQIMEGAYDKVTTILQRMRDHWPVQAATGSMTSTERALDAGHTKLASAIDSVMNQAKFANKDLAVADANTGVVISGAEASDTITVTLSTTNSEDADGIGVDATDITLNGGTAVADATSAISHIDDALNQVATQKA